MMREKKPPKKKYRCQDDMRRFAIDNMEGKEARGETGHDRADTDRLSEARRSQDPSGGDAEPTHTRGAAYAGVKYLEVLE